MLMTLQLLLTRTTKGNLERSAVKTMSNVYSIIYGVAENNLLMLLRLSLNSRSNKFAPLWGMWKEETWVTSRWSRDYNLAAPSALVRSRIKRPFAPSVMLVASVKTDELNVRSWVTNWSSDIYLMVKKNLRKPQLGNHLRAVQPVVSWEGVLFSQNNFDRISMLVIGEKEHKKGRKNVINQSFQRSKYTFRTLTYTDNQKTGKCCKERILAYELSMIE